MLEDNPVLLATLSDMNSGAGFEQALVRNVDLKALVDAGESGSIEGWAENVKMRGERQKQRDAYNSEMSKNEESTVKNMEKVVSELKLDEDQKISFSDFVVEVFDSAFKGLITEKTFKMLYKAMNYDKDMETKKEIQEKSEKNKEIENKIKSEEKSKEGDGLPKVASTSESDKSQKTPDSFVDKFKKMQNSKKDIYAKG